LPGAGGGGRAKVPGQEYPDPPSFRDIIKSAFWEIIKSALKLMSEFIIYIINSDTSSNADFIISQNADFIISQNAAGK
jgi:hypothetical protein